MSPLSTMPIEHMGLSVRAKNALKRAGLVTAQDVQAHIKANGLSSIFSIGPSLASEIEECVNDLIENEGFSFGVDEIEFSVANEKTAPIVPVELFDDFPIDILAEELGSDLIKRLKVANFEDMGELISLSQTVTNFTQNLSKSLNRLIDHKKKVLQESVSSGKLHPEAQYRKVRIIAWLNLDPDEYDQQMGFLNILAQANRFSSLSEELSVVFASTEERDLGIFLKYYNAHLTLEKIGQQQGLTRERVRQIKLRVATTLWRQIISGRQDLLYLQSALLFAQDLGDQLSLKLWKQLLESRKITESRSVREGLEPFDALLALLRSKNESQDSSDLGIELDEGINSVLNSTSDLSVGLIKTIEEMPLQVKRKIEKIVKYIGGIHITEASDILTTKPEHAVDILRHLGYQEVTQGWYTIAFGDFPRWPILNAGLAMMKICDSLDFDIFCDGVRRYISRLYDVIAPPRVMATHLKVLGFEIENGLVHWPTDFTWNLSEGELCFLLVVEKFGTVVSYQEVIEVFHELGYSSALASSKVLPQSPIVEKVDLGLYKLRGREHTWEDVENAKNRQITIDYDPVVTYGLDGITRYSITLGSWATNGAISISLSQQPLPDLGGGWGILVQDELLGTAQRDENLIWGLGGAFNALGVQIGDRVELAFDSWDKPVVRIIKV